MDESLKRSYFSILIGLSLMAYFGAVKSAIAQPSQGKDRECQLVARDLKSRKAYCAHELKSLKLQNEPANSPGILCYLVRQVVPVKALSDISQCIPSEFDSSTDWVTPKPKGVATDFAILQPIGSILNTSQPQLKWNSIPGASYRVTLESGDKWVWSQETKEAKLQLPAAHALKHGSFYKLSVIAFKGNDAIAEKFKPIALADPQIVTEIDDAISQSEKSLPNSVDSGLDRASMLAYAGLLDAAVIQLKSLFNVQDPAIYSQLSQIYKQAGQSEAAEKYSAKALELARKSKPQSQVN